VFKIKVAAAGPLSINLENDGCITLRPGVGFDLEPTCSRTWIENDPDLLRLIRQGSIIVVYDSAKEYIPRHNLTRHPRQADRPVMPEPPPEKVEAPPVQDTSEPQVTVLEPQVEDEKVDRIIQIPAEVGALNSDQLQALDLGTVREIAHKIGLPTQYRSKANIIKAILRLKEKV